MTFPRMQRAFTPGLILGLAIIVGLATPALAQPMSSGSGAGTGTGMSGGAGLSLPGSNRYAPLPAGRMPRVSPEQAVPLGPGATVTFPDESTIIPLDLIDTAPTPGGQKGSDLSAVTERHLKYARRIPLPGDRSLALSRIASAATFSNQLDIAEGALADSSEAALLMQPGMVQDQRLISIISALMGLAEARLREGRTESLALELNVPTAPGEKPAATPLPPRLDRNGLIRLAMTDWKRASDLAQRIGNPTYRNELMYRVADSISYGSQSIVNEFPRSGDSTDPGKDSTGLDRSFQGMPDQLLQDAATLATRIDRPAWHDQALFKVATAAAESRQYSRALNVARLIPQPEVRTNALLKIAEIQARRADPKGATSTYREAALAVASIPQEDPRAVLTGVLIDSLVSVGRFEDARFSTAIYPDEPRRVVALGAIAESQGRRGAAVSALQWINDPSTPAQYRSWLYRKVNNGVVAAIEDNRRRDLSNKETTR